MCMIQCDGTGVLPPSEGDSMPGIVSQLTAMETGEEASGSEIWEPGRVGAPGPQDALTSTVVDVMDVHPPEI